jgi:hypothetical protein
VVEEAAEHRPDAPRQHLRRDVGAELTGELTRANQLFELLLPLGMEGAGRRSRPRPGSARGCSEPARETPRPARRGSPPSGPVDPWRRRGDRPRRAGRSRRTR